MKVLLIKPFNYFHEDDFVLSSAEPLGLIYLATYINDKHDVEIFDATIGNNFKRGNVERNGEYIRYGVSPKEISRKIIDFKPDLVGVVAQFFTQSLAIKEVIEIIKNTLPETTLVAGGNCVSCMRELFLENHPSVDILVCGEGEITFKELCDSEVKNLKKIKGIIYRDKNNKIITNEARPLISDLNKMLYPDRSRVHSRFYHLQNAPFFSEIKVELHKIKFGNILMRLLGRNIITIPRNKLLARILSFGVVFKVYAEVAYFLTNYSYHPISADIETSRGCPFSCVFCAVKNTWTRKFRSRSIEHIRSELIYLIKNKKIKHVNITDDAFNIDKNRLYELCDVFVELKIKSWRPMSGLYIMLLNREILSRMYETGCKHISLIIESGCQDTLDNIIRKNVNITYAREIAEICKEIGFTTYASFVIGFPGETKENILETVKYAASLELDSCNFWLATPYPGTDLYEICLEGNYLPENFDIKNLHKTYHTNFSIPIISTEYFTIEEIGKLREVANEMICQKGRWEDWKDKLYRGLNYNS